jgi:hypothetical protein
MTKPAARMTSRSPSLARDAAVSAVQRAALRAVMAPPWAAQAWKSYLPKLYAGRRPADFGEYRDQVEPSCASSSR